MDDSHCPADMFNSFVNLQCYFTEADWKVSLIYSAVSLILLILGITVFWKSRSNKNIILQQTEGCDYDETYCSITVEIINYTQVMLLMSLILLSLTFLFNIIFDKFGPWFQT